MAMRKVDTVLDQELKALLEESDQHVFNGNGLLSSPQNLWISLWKIREKGE